MLLICPLFWTIIEPMITSWVLFATLSANPQPIQVYVDTNPPDWKSQHIIDALETPIEDLSKRDVDNPSALCYLWELEIARGRLMASGGVKVVSRDDSGLPSYIDLPAWSFSPREAPKPFVEGVYYHWTLVPENLEYLLSIKNWGIKNRHKINYVLMTKVEKNSDWFIVRQKNTPLLESWNGRPFIGEQVESSAFFRFLPSPPILGIPTPRRVVKRFFLSDTNLSVDSNITEVYNCTSEVFDEWIKAADMGTGIVDVKLPIKKEE